MGKTKNEFDPDYADNPEVLRGALHNSIEAGDNLMREITDLRTLLVECRDSYKGIAHLASHALTIITNGELIAIHKFATEEAAKLTARLEEE